MCGGDSIISIEICDVLCEECHQGVLKKSVLEWKLTEADVTLHRKINCVISDRAISFIVEGRCSVKTCQAMEHYIVLHGQALHRKTRYNKFIIFPFNELLKTILNFVTGMM